MTITKTTKNNKNIKNNATPLIVMGRVPSPEY